MDVLYRQSFFAIESLSKCFVSYFLVVVTFVVIELVNGGMFKFGLFFVNLTNLTSVKLHQFILPESWVLCVYSCILIYIINYTRETLFPQRKNLGVGFSFSGNISRKEYSLKRVYIPKSC